MARDLVFVCYSRQDQAWLDQLSPYLAFLQDQGLRVWTDREIKPGELWRDAIEEALSRARVAVLLVSIRFLTSKFIQEEELPTLLDAAEREGVLILWVYLETCPYKRSKLDFARYQATHDLEKPLDMIGSSGELKQVLNHISDQISDAAQRFQEQDPNP